MQRCSRKNQKIKYSDCIAKAIYFLVQLLAVQQVYARIGLDGIEDLHKHNIDTIDKKKMVINPEGPLSLLRPYISKEGGFLHNKRFFSPEIKISYSLATEEGQGVAENKRNSHMDAPYENPSAYIKGYHSALIEMFPSQSNILSIFTSVNRAFITFLRSSEVSEHADTILAALLLLSEGVNIPLYFEGGKKTKKLILKNTAGSKMDFSLNTRVLCTTVNKNMEETEEKFYQNEAIEVIQFFINSRECPSIQREDGEYAEPTSFENFMQGAFLNNARWLIQCYIFEYIGTPQQICALAQKVYDLLSLQIQSSSNSANSKEKADLVLKKCFVPADGHLESLKYVQAVKKIQVATHRLGLLPFSTKEDLPQEKSNVPFYIESSEFAKKQKGTFTDCVENAILTLFCCFAYDPKRQGYTTEHMPSASDRLNVFFSDYSDMFGSGSQYVHNDWNRVVACLQNEKIVYVKKNKNELEACIFNILYVIAEITNQSSDKMKELDDIVSKFKKGKNILNIYKSVEKYANSLFRSLLKEDSMKGITIDIESPLKQNAIKGLEKREYLYGNITLNYSCNKETEAICISVEPKHAEVAYPPQEKDQMTPEDIASIENTILQIKETLAREETFTSCMAIYYAEQMVRSLKESVMSSQIAAIQQVGRDMFRGIEGIFLFGKIDEIEQKKEIVSCVVMHIFEKNMGADSSIVRFISNVVGSMDLLDMNVKKNFLPILRYSKEYNEYYPSIDLNTESMRKHTYSTKETPRALQHVLSRQSPDILMKWIERIVSLKTDSGVFNLPFSFRWLSTEEKNCLIALITENGKSCSNMHRIASMLESKKDCFKACEAEITQLWVTWICLACQMEGYSEIIKECFNSIDTKQKNITIPEIGDSKYLEKTLEVLDSMHGDLGVSSDKEMLFRVIWDAYVTKLEEVYEREEEEKGVMDCSNPNTLEEDMEGSEPKLEMDQSIE
ncbi:uncharacterized protein NESG_01563 [Nematocida ausubeli]|uniref:Uncharacterized protein n=1 Tax=Nematocida ausubeli (strain ATCC PRA-371 / ERTm2) TaxID=1913371 RepID=A0A086J0B7_NEMA1|nr:uncharacterized protein NESG_01563 [Nematocida ausubeli]KFG25585.1 hypothetical protein NESG_01563 [Nematocida ausubeli]